jgi:acetyl esterase/lipase
MINLLNNMNPELQEAFRRAPSIDNTMDLVEIREALDAVLGGMTEAAAVSDRVISEDRRIPGAPGSPDVSVRLYRPVGKSAGPLPAVLYIHAGGFFFGNIDICDALCTHYVEAVGCALVSVDYRLAPENPYPAAIDDCYAALSWMHQSADELHIDRERIALCGASAGGCLVAATALLARDRGDFKVAFQILTYPCLDHRAVTPSSRAIFDWRVWNTPLAEKSWKAYLRQDISSDVPPYASPAMAKDLSGLPPAYIAICELDVLRDEAVEYATRLCNAGVSTELHLFPGTFHAFDISVPHAEISIRFDREITTTLRHALMK